MIKKLAKKYGLNLDPLNGDFWELPQRKGQLIIKHDACVKIQHKEGIKLVSMELPLATPDSVCVMVTMSKPTKEGEITHTTLGEANHQNCKNQYKFAMAQKRAIDRCVLQLINAYEYGVYSDSEAEEFNLPIDKKIKDSDSFLKLLESERYSPKLRRDAIAKWGDIKSQEGVDQMLHQMDIFVNKEGWDNSKPNDPKLEDENTTAENKHLQQIKMEV